MDQWSQWISEKIELEYFMMEQIKLPNLQEEDDILFQININIFLVYDSFNLLIANEITNCILYISFFNIAIILNIIYNS